jgi:hypothetical protein
MGIKKRVQTDREDMKIVARECFGAKVFFTVQQALVIIFKSLEHERMN